ncbi:MAG: WG repeat-containing protein [Bacteroidales bacterium]|nr:WG repeat-containing protein [Bacteroidales bacterium]
MLQPQYATLGRWRHGNGLAWLQGGQRTEDCREAGEGAFPERQGHQEPCPAGGVNGFPPDNTIEIVSNGGYTYSIDGQPILPPQFSDAKGFSGGYAIAAVGGKYGVLQLLDGKFEANWPDDNPVRVYHGPECDDQHFALQIPNALDKVSLSFDKGNGMEDMDTYSFSFRPFVKQDAGSCKLRAQIQSSDGLWLWEGEKTLNLTQIKVTANKPVLTWTYADENGSQVSQNANYTFTINANRYLVAQFQQSATYYTITVSASPTNGGIVTGGGSYPSGTTCTLHATPNSGYTFQRWTKDGITQSTLPDYSFTVTGNAAYVAVFQQSESNYTINVLANPTNGGSVTGGGTYQQGQQCTVTASPNTGYYFVNWTEGGTQVNATSNYSFTVTGNRVLEANFQALSYSIDVTIDPTEGGSVDNCPPSRLRPWPVPTAQFRRKATCKFFKALT